MIRPSRVYYNIFIIIYIYLSSSVCVWPRRRRRTELANSCECDEKSHSATFNLVSHRAPYSIHSPAQATTRHHHHRMRNIFFSFLFYFSISSSSNNNCRSRKLCQFVVIWNDATGLIAVIPTESLTIRLRPSPCVCLSISAFAHESAKTVK